MNHQLILQEFSIILAVEEQNPTALNPDTLKYTNVIPSNWELASAPIIQKNFVQLKFTTGVMIIAEYNRIILVQSLVNKSVADIVIPDIAKKYAQTFPNVKYQAVGINPNGYVSFSREQNTARTFLTKTLLSPGSWQEEGELPMRVNLNLVYKYERASMYLNITEAAIQDIDKTTTPIVIFGANYSYKVNGESSEEKLAYLHKVIDNWQVDLEAYSNLVNNKFLASLPKEVSSDVEKSIPENKAESTEVEPNLLAVPA